MEFPRLASVGLSLLLAANCFMPCYTLAYADESQEVADVPQEEQEEVIDSSGRFELPSGDGESIIDAADGRATAEGYGADNGAAEGSIEDTSSDNGGLGGAVVYDVEPDPDYSIVEEGDGGLDDSYGGFDTDLLYSSDDLISPHASFAVIDTLVASAWSGTSTAFTTSLGYNWSAKNGTLIWVVSMCAYRLEQILSSINTFESRADAYLKAIDTSGKSVSSSSSDIVSKLSATHTFSPDSSSTTYSVAEGIWRLYQLLYLQYSRAGDQNSYVNNWNTVAWGFNPKSSTQSFVQSSPGWFLANTYLSQHGTHSFSPDSTPVNYSTAEGIWRLYQLLYLQYTRTGEGNNYFVANNSLLSRGLSDLLDSQSGVHSFGVEGKLESYTTSEALWRIWQQVYDSKQISYTTKNYVSDLLSSQTGYHSFGIDGKFETYTTSEVLWRVWTQLHSINEFSADLKTAVDEIRLYTSRHVLNVPDEYEAYTLWDLLYSLMIYSDNAEMLLMGLQQTLTAWGNRWDSQDLYLMEWAKRWDALDKVSSWSESDKSFLFAKLDGISDRLSVEAGQTILDALLGEVKPQYINDQLTIVKEVARNRFPFCIPAMMQQMLGLMQSEAQVPHWEFDFFGSPLVLDLGDLEGFASVTRWASCFMLFLALLANTKRFIFDLGGGGK